MSAVESFICVPVVESWLCCCGVLRRSLAVMALDCEDARRAFFDRFSARRNPKVRQGVGVVRGVPAARDGRFVDWKSIAAMRSLRTTSGIARQAERSRASREPTNRGEAASPIPARSKAPGWGGQAPGLCLCSKPRWRSPESPSATQRATSASAHR